MNIAAIITYLNANPWMWVAALAVGRGLIKWIQAGRPNGIGGLLQSIVSFVPQPGPQPGPGPTPINPTTNRPIIDGLLKIISLLGPLKGEHPELAKLENELKNSVVEELQREGE